MVRMHQIYTRAAVAAAVAAVALGVQPPGASAQNYSNNGSNVVLNRGTVILVRLSTELTSSGSQQGEAFTATVDSTKNAYRQILDGATVDGVVRNATPQDGQNAGTLEVAFTRLHLSSGSSYAISGSPTSLDPKYITTRADGVLQAKNTNKDEHLTYAGIGGGAGAHVSVLLNGNIKVKDTLLDTAIGGILGYVAGSVIKGPKQVHDVDLKPGTEMGVLLNNDVTYSNNPQPGAYPQQGGYQQGVYQGGYQQSTGGQQSYVSNGTKYYYYGGQKWAMNLATGQRNVVSNRSTYATSSNSSGPRSHYKYYTYQGNRYVLNNRTGQRTLLR